MELENLPVGIYPSNYTEACKKDLQLKKVTEMKYLHFIRDAVYAYAQALHNLHSVYCNGEPGVCERMRNADGSVLKFYLENADFTDQYQKLFKFYKGGDGPPRYSILNFQKQMDGSYVWKEIGSSYLGADNQPKLEIDRRKMQYKRYNHFYPNSTCKEHCDAKKGLVPYVQSNNSCCPDCKKCEDFEMIQGGHCQPCPNGQKPNENRSRCQLIEEQVIDYRNPWVAVSMAFAILGILLSLLVAFVFWRHRHTPVIKASGRELSAILLMATLFSFAMTFVLASQPSYRICALTRFSLGLTHTLSFAAIAVKTNRVARIFGQKMGASAATCPRAKYISPRSQVTITAALTLIEVLINVSWLLYRPPHTTHISPEKYSRILICQGMETYSYLVGLVYPFVLVGSCTVYAFQTRKCPGGFNEARYIAFTTYTTCVLWLAFITLFLASSSCAIRIVTLAMSLSISGFVQLACLFAPKVYIVLYKPEKNTRESIMAQHRSSSYALPTPPAIALNSMQHQHQQQHQQLSSINGSRHSQQPQHQRRSQMGLDGPYIDEERKTNQNISNEMKFEDKDPASTSSATLDDSTPFVFPSRVGRGNVVHFSDNCDVTDATDATDDSKSSSTNQLNLY